MLGGIFVQRVLLPNFLSCTNLLIRVKLGYTPMGTPPKKGNFGGIVFNPTKDKVGKY